MKKLSIIIALCAVMLMALLLFVACDSNSGSSTVAPKQYSVQYADDEGTHSLLVESGRSYALATIPSRNGYVFKGLYDAPSGGTQYVYDNGISVSPYNETSDIVLFAQFEPKEYTLALDFQGAPVTGAREYRVQFDGGVPSLPTNVSLEHKDFVGWFTAPNCWGTQIADEYGVLPGVVVNDRYFDLRESLVALYAGFVTTQYTVTCCFEPGMPTEELKIDYNTPVNDIAVETRVNGKAPIAWSKTQGGEAFSGKITGDTVLYAIEYGSVIDFDTDGGEKLNPIVERSGMRIDLPTPTKQNMHFAYWMDREGNEYDNNIMPADNVTLKAKWWPMLIFDENGGTPVADIAAAPGETVELPTPEREGYIFAGWYVGDEQYTSTIMPQSSRPLTAKYHKIEKKQYVIVNQTSSIGYEHAYPEFLVPNIDKRSRTLDLSELYDAGVRTIKFTVYYQAKYEAATIAKPQTMYMNWYKEKDASDAYKIWGYGDTHTDGNYANYTHTTTLNLTGKYLYVCWFSTDVTGIKDNIYWTNFWVEVEYPDMTTLY